MVQAQWLWFARPIACAFQLAMKDGKVEVPKAGVRHAGLRPRLCLVTLVASSVSRLNVPMVDKSHVRDKDSQRQRHEPSQ
jgi:hypothetical protein